MLLPKWLYDMIALLSLLVLWVPCRSNPPSEAPAPTRVHDGFVNVLGGTWHLPRNSKAIVLIFFGHDCPISNGFAPEINRLHREFSPLGIEFCIDPGLTLARKVGATIKPVPFALNLDRDVYLRGVEVLPSNPRVAHHAVGILDPWGAGRKLAKQSRDYQGFGYVNLGGPGFIPSGFTPGYVPGATPRFFPDDQAIRLPKGTDFVLQMHYHPSGTEETDEMAGVILGGLPVRPEEEWLVWAAVIGHYFEVHSQATPKRPLVREGTFNSDGVRIHYAVQGKGPAVVLIHAWLTDSTMWGKNRWGDNGIVAALAERFQVITLDCRGHGQSDKPHDIKAYGSKMAEDVVRLLDHLKIDKAHLVGYSMGAILAGKVVAMHPKRVRSVIFAGGAPVLEWDPADVKRGEAFLNQWEKDRGLQALTHFLVGPQDRAALAAAHRSLRTIRVSAEELKRYTGPLLFIYGREEWPSTKRYVAAARQVWGRGEVIVIGNADHLSTPSRPEFRQAILTFLKAQAP
jgi:pimeloyl-ACP methyl ester carboxylesterase